jgi:hypothetical protein
MNGPRSPSIQFYFRQFLGDEEVQMMELDAVGAHILLMCAAGASSSGYRLPTDERKLRALIRNPPDEAWSRIKAQVLGGAWKKSRDGRWWEQAGLYRSFAKQKKFRDAQARKGKLSGEARRKRTGVEPRLNPGLTQTQPAFASASASASAKQELGPRNSRPLTAAAQPAANSVDSVRDRLRKIAKATAF